MPDMQPTQSYSVGGQHSSGQLTGKPAGVQPVYRGRWYACPFHGLIIPWDQLGNPTNPEDATRLEREKRSKLEKQPGELLKLADGCKATA
ncbi:UNVERIFIED_CONTAM: hypothetical protein FKN15_042804 [Acipenser sinensis]